MFTYGEIVSVEYPLALRPNTYTNIKQTFSSFYQILILLKIRFGFKSKDATFYDLGTGSGKPILAA